MKSFIEVASGRKPAQLVFKNIDIVDVFTQEIYRGDVAVQDGYIVGVGSYCGKTEIDGTGKYIAPSFIDAHMHIESSLVSPAVYSDAVLPLGVTTIIADPHEIANVAGKDGIKYMLESTEKIELDAYIMLPSCVPATNFESSGAILNSKDLEEFYLHPRVLGLAEVMNYPAVLNCEGDMLDKINFAKKNGKHIDGHGAGLGIPEINAYIAAGVSTDHECQNPQELKERLRRGMYVLMREGTAAKNISELAKAVTPSNSRRVCVCTDDKHIDQLLEEGSIDSIVRLLIESGVPVTTAYQMASLNSAECYGLSEIGAIAPGYRADFIIISDLEKVSIEKVFKGGELVADNGVCVKNSKDICSIPEKLVSSMNFGEVLEDDIQIYADDKSRANIIEIKPNRLETKHIVGKVEVRDGKFQISVEMDQLKMLVIERHKNTGSIGKGIVKGFGLKKGAIATSVAHDSHNIIALGTNDDDIIAAIEELRRIGGGIAVSVGGKIEASLELEIGGLISKKSSDKVVEELEKLHKEVACIMGCSDFNPFLTLSFMSLPVIPEIKLTDKGVFDVRNFCFIDVMS